MRSATVSAAALERDVPRCPFGRTCSYSAVGKRTLLSDRHFFGLSPHVISKSHDHAVCDAIGALARSNREERVMNPKSKLALALVVGVAVGAAAVNGLHAQAKPKAYQVTEHEIIDAAAYKTFLQAVRAAQQAAS